MHSSAKAGMHLVTLASTFCQVGHAHRREGSQSLGMSTNLAIYDTSSQLRALRVSCFDQWVSIAVVLSFSACRLLPTVSPPVHVRGLVDARDDQDW